MFGFMILGYIIYMIYIVPINLAILGIFAIISVLFSFLCIKPLVSLRMLCIKSTGPITKIFQEATSGILTIRSLGLQRYFYTEFVKVNYELATNFSNYIYFCRYYMILVSVGAASCLCLNVFFILIFLGNADSALASVSLTFNVAIMSYLPWTFREIVELMSLSSSLEKVSNFLTILPESQTGTEKLCITQGKIEFENVELAYPGYLELALNNVSFEVEGGTKLGVIGRSGSGKSSIFNVLFRLNSITKGLIKIDGQDISKVDICSLRTSIAIIPQSPFIFQGSLKLNVDPFETVCDEEIFRIMKIVQLDSLFLQNGLETDIFSLELSLGQKQLIALARVLIQNNQILLLDEPTAYVDSQTDFHMQEVINEHYDGRTVISIAHKLQFVLNYDMVALMDNGFIIDILPPAQVLTRDHSKFCHSIHEVE